MADNFPEAGAAFCHRLRPTLAEADTVPLTRSYQNHFPAVISRGEIVARYGIPAKSPVDCESPGFTLTEQTLRIPLRNLPGPAGRMFIAIIANNRKIRIPVAGHADLSRNTRVATATAREHHGNWFPFEMHHQAARGGSSDCRWAFRIGRFAQELAMSEIAKIKLVMPALASYEVRACDYRLRLQSFQWRIRRGFRLDNGGHRRFQIHCDNGNDKAVRRLDCERTAILLADSPGDRERESSRVTIAARGVNSSGANDLPAKIKQ